VGLGFDGWLHAGYVGGDGMTKLTEHAKTILHAIADGKDVERKSSAGNWYSITAQVALSWIGDSDATQLRIKPETCSINGVEFGAPVIGGGYRLTLRGGKPSDIGDAFDFATEQDRDTAYQAIVDALEGKTK